MDVASGLYGGFSKDVDGLLNPSLKIAGCGA
jgi:hypothetical protein